MQTSAEFPALILDEREGKVSSSLQTLTDRALPPAT